MIFESSKPSGEQVLETIYGLSKRLPRCYSAQMQQWVEWPGTPFIMERLINLGPVMVRNWLDAFKPTRLDILKTKGRLLGYKLEKEDLEIGEGAWSRSFKGQEMAQMTRLFIKLGLGISSDFMNGLPRIEQIPTKSANTYITPESVREDLSKCPPLSREKFLESGISVDRIASIEEILDFVLNVAIEGLLLGEQFLMTHIRNTCFPKGSYSIICRNRSGNTVPVLIVNLRGFLLQSKLTDEPLHRDIRYIQI